MKWLREPWFTPTNPARSQRRRHLHGNNKVVPLPQQVNLLYCLCAVCLCAERVVSGWYVCPRFSIYWQIYQGNVHLWWACFYIWDWGGELSLEPKQRRREGTWRQAEDIWHTVCVPHALMHKFTVCSHSQSQQLALPQVQQGRSDTVARCAWRGVYTKHFPRPGPVSTALNSVQIHTGPSQRTHSKASVCDITQHNKMPLPLEVKAGLISVLSLTCVVSLSPFAMIVPRSNQVVSL